jgi:predicted aldo/keto reductase-like oxidoreductase
MEPKKVSRREFLRLSATVGAGALLFPNVTASAAGMLSGSGDGEYPTRLLGRTGLETPILGVGVMRSETLVKAAYGAGLTFFDTAHGYQNGRNEEMMGRFFRDKPRNSFTLATRERILYPLDDRFEEEYTASLDLSLKRLQTDFVDIFYIHAADDTPVITEERVVRLLKRFRDEGKIRHVGVASHANKPEMIDAAIRAGIYDVFLLSYNFKLENLAETDAAIERGVQSGMGFVAMKTMAGGVEDAEGRKKIDAGACLKWAWQNKNIAVIIPGFSSLDEFNECLAAVRDPEPTAAEIQYIATLRGKELLYCRQCGRCGDGCPEHLPIPDLMRAYMYAYGYKNAGQAKETLLELHLPENICARCDGRCRVTCAAGFDVASKIAAVTPVMRVPDAWLT